MGTVLVKPEAGGNGNGNGNGDDTPTVELNDEKLAFNSDALDPYAGEIVSITDEDNLKVYHIKINGFGLVDNDGSHGGDYTPNEYQIKVDPTNQELVSIEYIHFGDTPGFGDRTVNEAYYELFEGLSTIDYDQEVATATRATATSRSMIKAVKIVMDDLNK